MIEPQAAGGDRLDQVEALADRRDIGLDAGDLGAHVQVQAARVERLVSEGK